MNKCDGGKSLLAEVSKALAMQVITELLSPVMLINEKKYNNTCTVVSAAVKMND